MILIYLGRRGGGSQLLLSTLLGVDSRDVVREVWISSENEDLHFLKTLNIQLRIFDIAHEYRLLLNPLITLKVIISLIKLFLSALFSGSKIFVQIMPSPTDLFIDIAAYARGKKIVRVVHDFQNHPGEMWPTARAINIRLRIATHVVTFSQYVMNNLPRLTGKETHVCLLPNQLVIHSQAGREVKEIAAKLEAQKLPIILAIGRIQEYKGLEQLEAIGKELEDLCIFVIAGSGMNKFGQSSNVLMINQWLTEAEFDLLLDLSSVVVFPYTEASQSGTIPLAIKKGKYVVCSKVGGLAEQVFWYSKATLVPPNDANALQMAIEDWIDQIKNKSNQKSIQGPLSRSDNASGNRELWEVLLAVFHKENH